MTAPTRERFRDIYERFQGQISGAGMGRMLGVSRERARQLSRALDLPLGLHRELRRCAVRAELLRDALRTDRAIARTLGVGTDTVSEVRAKLGAPRSPLRPCGTATAYDRGCRCEACRAANARKMREWTLKNPGYVARQKRERLREGRFKHGTRSGYSVGCRCEKCRAAYTAYGSARRAKIRGEQ